MTSLQTSWARFRGWQLAPLFLTSLIVWRWFEPGYFVGTGDVAPLIRRGLASETGSFWNHQMSGAGSTTADAGRSVEILLIDLVRALGGDELVAQRLLFILAMGLACAGASHVASLVLRHPASIAVAGLLGACNPFVLLQLPNVIFPLTIGVIGLLLGETCGFLIGRRTNVLRLALASTPLIYLSINPPLVAVATITVLGPLLVVSMAHRELMKTMRFLLTSAPLLVGIHLFWIAPALVVYRTGAEGVTFSAVTDAAAWSWVYAENRLDRVITLTAHWAWPTRQYFPWTERLDQAPWTLLRWILPMGALAGTVFAHRSQRRVAVSLAALAAALLVFSQGLHEPFGAVNAVLYDQVPGWWLFRDPVSKFGPPLVLIYVLLFGLFTDRLLDVALAPSFTSSFTSSFAASLPTRAGARGLMAAASLGALVYPWPLINGDVIPADRGDLPPSHVHVPPAWDELSDVVATSAVEGKVAVLPLNDYYQVTTTWDYHGVDLVNQLFDRPVLQRLPGGYFGEVAGYDDLLEGLQVAVVDGHSSVAQATFDALGASHLLVRHDVVDPAMSGEMLNAGARQIEGLEVVMSNEVATLYVRPQAQLLRAVSSTVAATAGTEAWAVGRNLGAVVGPADGADSFAWRVGSDEHVALSLASGELAVSLDEGERVDLTFELVGDELVGRMADQIKIDGSTLTSEPLVVLSMNGKTLDAVAIGDRHVPFVDGMTEPVHDGELIRALGFLEGPRPSPGQLSDCSKEDDRPINQLGFDEKWDSEAVMLSAAEHSACIAFSLEIEGERPALSFTIRSISGAPARFCLWSDIEDRCVVGETVDSAREVKRIFDLTATSTDESLELFVYADGAGGGTTTARYSRPTLSSLVTIGQQQFQTGEPVALVEVGDPPASLSVLTQRLDLLGPFGDVGDCNRSDDRTFEELGISATVRGDAVELAASDHAACVDARISAPMGDDVVVSFDYVSPTGSLPRFCVWQAGIDRCADAPPVREPGSYRALVRTDPTATGLYLYLYVDGSEPEAVVRFSQVSVRRSAMPAFTVVPADQTGRRAPVVISRALSTSSYEVRVTEASDEFVLILPESFSPGWRIQGLPASWSAEHLIVNGFSNGWRVSPAGSTVGDEVILSVAYGPGSDMAYANAISLTSLGLLGLGAVGSVTHRPRRRLSPAW